jgi:hypothetical protein
MKRRALALLASLALLSLSPGLAFAGTATADQSNLLFDHLIKTSNIDAQTFTAGITGTLESVELYFIPTPHGSVYVTIQGTTGSTPVPNNTVLASKSVAVPASSPGAWFRIYFPVTPAVTAGDSYAIVFSPTDNVSVYGVKNDVYSRGRGLAFSGGSWVLPANLPSPVDIRDFAFRTYVVRAAVPTHAPTARPVVTPAPTASPVVTAAPTAPPATPTPTAVEAATPTAAATDSPSAVVAGVTDMAGATAAPGSGLGSPSAAGGSDGSMLPLVIGGIVALGLLRRRRAAPTEA